MYTAKSNQVYPKCIWLQLYKSRVGKLYLLPLMYTHDYEMIMTYV